MGRVMVLQLLVLSASLQHMTKCVQHVPCLCGGASRNSRTTSMGGEERESGLVRMAFIDPTSRWLEV